MKPLNYKVLIASLVIVYAIAFIGSTFTSSSVSSDWYDSIKPSITPPNFVFPIVWNILFFLIAISIYISWISAKNTSTKKSIAILFGLNLFFNVLWSFIFFSQQNPETAFFELIALWISIIALLILTYRINRTATYLLIPYALWVTFAGILNWLIAF
ncbi:MAG: tryptophan-rich sensory protein [Nanoarchaeota archaeon]|nr:tryptophan-rich sensory protein [Nanoarchaeota archaeon]